VGLLAADRQPDPGPRVHYKTLRPWIQKAVQGGAVTWDRLGWIEEVRSNSTWWSELNHVVWQDPFDVNHTLPVQWAWMCRRAWCPRISR